MYKIEIASAMFPWTIEGTVETLSHNKVTKRNIWEISARKTV
jgi:hypothetical protein